MLYERWYSWIRQFLGITPKTDEELESERFSILDRY